MEIKIGSGKRNIRNASGKQNQSNKKSTASGKQKINKYKHLHQITKHYNFISHQTNTQNAKRSSIYF